MAEAEARGETFWTSAFSDRVRSRVLHAFSRVADDHSVDRAAVMYEARTLILEEEGGDSVFSVDLSPYEDIYAVLQGEDEDEDLYALVLEAMLQALMRRGKEIAAFKFRDRIQEIFAQERVAWRLVALEMIEMKSEELYEAVVEPALRLLHDPRLARVDETYRKALDELSNDDGPDAITDAGTALQELLQALGCEGNQLGDLIRSAKRKSLLAGHDTTLLAAIERAMHWVAADRSESGESHHASNASRDDAWLMVHVVGAFIVRLAADLPRPPG